MTEGIETKDSLEEVAHWEQGKTFSKDCGETDAPSLGGIVILTGRYTSNGQRSYQTALFLKSALSQVGCWTCKGHF